MPPERLRLSRRLLRRDPLRQHGPGRPRAGLAHRGQPWNPLFEDFTRHYGIRTRLCWPYRPETKGKIECTIGFIKSNFFLGRPFTGLGDLNRQAQRWCNTVNAERIHATTGVVPISQLDEEQLHPVAGRAPYQIVVTEARHVSRECFVSYRGNRYSVPWRFAGREAQLEIRGGELLVRVDGEERCRHELRAGSGAVVRVKEHFAGLYGATRQQNLHEFLRTHREEPPSDCRGAAVGGLRSIPRRVRMRSLAYDRLHANLQTMDLSTIERNLDGALEIGTKEERSLTEILDELVDQEVKARHALSTETRLRLAGFPVRKTLDEFDFEFQPSIDPKAIEELATMRFVHNAENVILVGPSGVGKTHLAIALGIEAARAGLSVTYAAAGPRAHETETGERPRRAGTKRSASSAARSC